MRWNIILVVGLSIVWLTVPQLLWADTAKAAPSAKKLTTATDLTNAERAELGERLNSLEAVADELANAPDLTDAERAALEERLRLLEGLLVAKPAPMPPHGITSIPTDPGYLVRFDLGTRVAEEIRKSADGLDINNQDGPFRVPEHLGIPLPGIGNDGGDGTSGNAPNAPASCNPPSLDYATHAFPWRTVVKLLMRFDVGGTDFYYVCSAATVSPFHLITAGHCLFNWDPNDDGNDDDAAWADEVWCWPAQTDLVNPFACDPGCPVEEDFPYGVAKAVMLYSYDGWTGSEDHNHDMGYIALDRRIGDRVGWMGAETNTETASLNFDGYPTQTPYVPQCTVGPYPGYDENNVTGYTTHRIEMCAYIYGGHSGGPDWRYWDDNRYIQGVNSTSDRSGSAEATRLTNNKFTDLYDTIIPADEASIPPVARPELIEYVLDLNAKDVLENSVCQGMTFDVEYNLYNVGFANTGTITVDFYMSSNTCIRPDDHLIGSVTLGALDANVFYNPTTTLTVPCTVPAGTYYVGWIMSCATPEYNTDDNSVVIANETVTVVSGAQPPVISANATGGEVDENCEFAVPFDATITDDCGIFETDVSVSAQVISGTATLGTPMFTTTQVDPTTVTLEGTVLVGPPVCAPVIVQITVDAVDVCGASETESVTAEVIDAIAPEISVELNRYVLWPPNHKMADIFAVVTVEDACDPNPDFELTSIVSNEPDNGKGDGNTVDDIQGADFGTPDVAFQLRSERSGLGDGRIYTIVYTVEDCSGNTNQDTVRVRVPHDHSGWAFASMGFGTAGVEFEPYAKQFVLVIPSKEAEYGVDENGKRILLTEAFDATSLDISRVYVGNVKGVAVPERQLEVDNNADGLMDLAVYYPVRAVNSILAASEIEGVNYGPVGLHYVSAEGTDYLVPDIFDLGEPVPLVPSIEIPRGRSGTGEGHGEETMPSVTALRSAYPNPFNPTTTIPFSLVTQERVLLRIYDARGKLVRTMKNEVMPAGYHEVVWNGRDKSGNPVATGVYFVHFVAGSYEMTKKVVMIK